MNTATQERGLLWVSMDLPGENSVDEGFAFPLKTQFTGALACGVLNSYHSGMWFQRH